MIIARYDINCDFGEIIKIKPISDVHYGNSYCDVEAFNKFLIESDNRTYFIGLGDLLDSIIVTDKRYQKSSDATESDAIINEICFEMIDILKPYKEQIIGLGRGNHEETIIRKCSTDPISIVCKILDVKYLGFSFIINLNINKKIMVVIRGHHGWGGGSRTQGASITTFSRDMQNYDADIFLYGHVHKLQYDRIEVLGVNRNKFVSRPRYLCICGTFLKTFSEGVEASYSEVKGFPPVAIGGLEICIKVENKGFDISIASERFTYVE